MLPRWEIRQGDSLLLAGEVPDNSIDCVVTDPPAGISFCAKEWDSDRGGREAWIAWLASIMKEALRAVKPGGYALVWAIPRTSHWTATAIEDAGWVVRDVITHHFASGFPKGLDIGKAMDRMRDDDIYHLTGFIREARDRAGLTNPEIDAHFGFCGMAGHWTSDRSQPAVPRWEHWLRLKELLKFGDEMDAEVQRLNGRKGKPGDPWYERPILGKVNHGIDGHLFRKGGAGPSYKKEFYVTGHVTPEAHRWDGWNTTLKPSSEHWILAQKPIQARNIGSNILKWGAGALNIKGCEIPRAGDDVPGWHDSGADGSQGYLGTGTFKTDAQTPEEIRARRGQRGRWPGNVVFSHSLACECVGTRRFRGCPQAVTQGGTDWSGYSGATRKARKGTFQGYGDADGMETVEVWRCAPDCPVGRLEAEVPGASRYFYCAKPTRQEKEAGCDHLPTRVLNRVRPGGGLDNDPHWTAVDVKNNHPTVKPINLMRWFCRLICPPGGTVWDLFCGSGTTGCAAVLEGFDFLGFEQEAEYVEISKARIRYWALQAEQDSEEIMPPEPAPEESHLARLPEPARSSKAGARVRKLAPVGQPALF